MADALEDGLEVADVQLGKVLENEHAFAHGIGEGGGQGLEHVAFGLAVHQGEQVGEGFGAGGLLVVAEAGGEFFQTGVYFGDQFEGCGVTFRHAAGHLDAHLCGEAPQDGGPAVLGDVGEDRGNELGMLVGEEGSQLLAAGAGEELQGDGGLRAAAGTKALDDLGGLLLAEGAGNHGLGIAQASQTHLLRGVIGLLKLGQHGLPHVAADALHGGQVAGDALDLFLTESGEDGGRIFRTECDEERARPSRDR